MCKFAVLQAYSPQLYYQMNSLAGIFWQHFKSPPCSPMYWLKPLHQILKSLPPSNGGGRGGGYSPSHVLNTCGKPWMMMMLAVNCKDKKMAWKIYHEKHSNMELARDRNNLSQAHAVSRHGDTYIYRRC